LGDLERVFPFRLAAETIRQLLVYPGANNVKQFSHTATKLISIKVDNPNHEKKEVQSFENDLIKIVAIERDKEFIIPDSQTVVMHGDLIYFLGNGSVLESLYGQLDLHMPPRIQTAVVFGADLLGIEVAKILIEENIEVKVVEKDIRLCEKASDVLQDRALVINSHYDEAILYEEEQLHQADMLITTDSIRHVLQWNNKANCQLIQARPIKLRFHLNKAKLYSFTPRIRHTHYVPSYD